MGPRLRWVRYFYPVLQPWLFFFFQAEDGIRDLTVTGVQTCALPILGHKLLGRVALEHEPAAGRQHATVPRSFKGHAPALLLCDGVPGDECSLGCRHHASTDLGIGGDRRGSKKETPHEDPRRPLPPGFSDIP